MTYKYNRHYCYRIDFADGFVYFGVRTCSCSIAADSYMGSPATHRAKWQTATPRAKTIVSVHATRKLANEAEAELISDFWAASKKLSLNAAVHGSKFNMQGTKHEGRLHTDETKAKLSKTRTGKTHTDETKAKISKTRKGVKPTAETRAKISKAKKGVKLGKPCAAETRAKISKAGKGKLRTAETKAKMSNAKKGKTKTAETRAKMSNAKKGVKPTAETRAKLSDAGKGRLHTAESKAKISKAGKGKLRTAETKAKISESAKGKKWYTNGIDSVKLKPGHQVPDGFKPGMLKRKQL